MNGQDIALEQPETTQVIRERGKAGEMEVRSLEERTSEFDNHYGPDIDIARFGAVSGYALMRLRELLKDSNPNYYPIPLSRNRSNEKQFPLEKSEVYGRFRDGCIEIFAEEDLTTGEVGFTYGRLSNFTQLYALRDSFEQTKNWFFRLYGAPTLNSVRNRIVNLTVWEIDTRLAYQKALGLVPHDYKKAEDEYHVKKAAISPVLITEPVVSSKIDAQGSHVMDHSHME